MCLLDDEGRHKRVVRFAASRPLPSHSLVVLGPFICPRVQDAPQTPVFLFFFCSCSQECVCLLLATPTPFVCPPARLSACLSSPLAVSLAVKTNAIIGICRSARDRIQNGAFAGLFADRFGSNHVAWNQSGYICAVCHPGQIWKGSCGNGSQ